MSSRFVQQIVEAETLTRARFAARPRTLRDAPLRKRPFEEAWAPTRLPDISAIGGIFFSFQSAPSGGEDHTLYITRVDATEGRREALELHNYPDWLEREGMSYDQLRERVCEYNR